MYIRSLFEANKHVTEPRQQRVGALGLRGKLRLTLSCQVIIKETENLLEQWKHPDPYRPPTAPGGESTRLEMMNSEQCVNEYKGRNTSAICPHPFSPVSTLVAHWAALC
jgi:hypothetical protein